MRTYLCKVTDWVAGLFADRPSPTPRSRLGRIETLEDRYALSTVAGAMPPGCVCPLCAPRSAPQVQSDEFRFTNGGTSVSGASKWSQPGGLGSTITITYSYNNLLDGGLGGGLEAGVIRSAIEEALGRWAAVAPIRFVEVSDSGPALAAGMNDYSASGRPMLRFGHVPEDGPSGTLAYAYYPGGTGLAGDVFFDRGETWSNTPTRGIDLIEVATHEIGHALGMAHEPMPSSGGNNAIMNPFYGARYRGPGTSFLLADDINGIRTLYGSGSGSVTPLNAAPAEPPPTPRNVTGTSFTDGFNRANSFYLGAEWASQAGNIQLSNNQAVGMAGGTSIASLRGVAARDVAVQADVNVTAGSNQSVGLMARYSGPGESNFYLAEAYGTPGNVTLSIYRNVGGSYTLLAQTRLSSVSGAMRFEAIGSSLKVYVNDQFRLGANDTLLDGPATVGIRTNGEPGAVSLDNFAYQQLTQSAPPALPFSDSFAAATRNQLSDKYVEQAGNFQVTGGVASNSTSLAIATLRGVSQRDVSVSGDINIAAGSGRSIGLVARYSGPGEQNFYLAEVYGVPGSSRAQVNLYLKQAGAYVKLASTAVASATGSLRFEVVGNSQRVFLNNTLILSANDTTLDGDGSAGFRASGAAGTVTLDNFAASAVTPPPPVAVPFNDTFTTAGALGGNYTEQVGTFQSSGGVASNSTALAIATLRGVSQRDQTVSGSVNVAAGSGNSIGLMARYSGPGENNFYLAEVYGVPGSSRVQVNLYLKQAGAYVRLATTTVASGSGALRFEVIGSTQRVFLNNTMVLSANDSTLTGSGPSSAGFRASGAVGAVTMDNFAVS